MSREDPTDGEFRWIARAGRPAGADDRGPASDAGADAADDPSPSHATRMTAGLRVVWTLCWVGSAVGLGVGTTRLIGVSAALLGPRTFDGLLADAAWSGAVGSALFAFGMLACYWVVKRDRRGLGALLVYLAAVTVAGVGLLDSPAGYLALAVPLAGMAELVYNGRRGYFDAPVLTPTERVEAALDRPDEEEETPGRHPRSTGEEASWRRRL